MRVTGKKGKRLLDEKELKSGPTLTGKKVKIKGKGKKRLRYLGNGRILRVVWRLMRWMRRCLIIRCRWLMSPSSVCRCLSVCRVTILKSGLVTTPRGWMIRKGPRSPFRRVRMLMASRIFYYSCRSVLMFVMPCA